MDEPFSALDVQTRAIMSTELLHLWDQTRPAVVFVTHDLEEAIALADKVVVLTAGPGTVKAEFRDRPAPPPRRPGDPLRPPVRRALRADLGGAARRGRRGLRPHDPVGGGVMIGVSPGRDAVGSGTVDATALQDRRAEVTAASTPPRRRTPRAPAAGWPSPGCAWHRRGGRSWSGSSACTPRSSTRSSGASPRACGRRWSTGSPSGPRRAPLGRPDPRHARRRRCSASSIGAVLGVVCGIALGRVAVPVRVFGPFLKAATRSRGSSSARSSRWRSGSASSRR